MYLSAVVGFTSTAILSSKHWIKVFSIDSLPIGDTVRSGGGGYSLLIGDIVRGVDSLPIGDTVRSGGI